MSGQKNDFKATQEVLANKNEAKLSWAEIQYAALLKLFDARFVGDMERFKSGVTALEILMSGHKDDDYIKEIILLEKQKSQMTNSAKRSSIDIFYYDRKMEALSNLITRMNKGIAQIRELLDDSDLVKEIATKLLKGIGQNVFITGPPGSGKSYTGMALALEILKYTGVDYDSNNVVFTPEEFMKVYNNDKRTPQGGFVMFDEAGVSYNSKDFAKEGNKLFSKLLMTIRHRAVLVIFTAPDLSNMDKDGRKLLHWWFETVDKDERRKIVTLKPYAVKVIQRTGDIHFPFPFFNGRKLSRLEVLKIEDEHSKPYELKAKRFKDDLAVETGLLLSSKKDGKVEEIKLYLKLRNTGMMIKDVCEKMGIHRNKGTRLERYRHNELYQKALS